MKAVRRGVRKNPNAKIELYDLSVDLAEKTDIADQHPEIVKTMSDLFAKARTESSAFRLFKK